MFTVGYTGWLKAKLPWWKSFGALLAILALWPMFLGMEFGGCFDENDTANARLDRQEEARP
jgi:hypothetical protein